MCEREEVNLNKDVLLPGACVFRFMLKMGNHGRALVIKMRLN